MDTPTVTIGPHAHRIKIEMPENNAQFLALVARVFGVESPLQLKLPPMVTSNWNFGTPGLKEIVLEDVRLRPFQQSETSWLSATKAVQTLRAEGRRPMNGLEAVAIVRAIEKGEIKLPAPCLGIHFLGAGMGQRVLVLRKTKHGEWQFARIPSNHTKGFYYASCKA